MTSIALLLSAYFSSYLELNFNNFKFPLQGNISYNRYFPIALALFNIKRAKFFH